MLSQKIDVKMAELIAFLLSDASLHNHKLPSSEVRKRISINITDLALCTKFADLCNIIFHKKLKMKERKNREQSKVFRCEMILPKNAENELFKFCQTFRTKPINNQITGAKVPEEIVNGSLEIKKAF
jgi:hypothetical protein